MKARIRADTIFYERIELGKFVDKPKERTLQNDKRN